MNKKEAIPKNDPQAKDKGNNFFGMDKQETNRVIGVVCDVCGIHPDMLQERSKREPLPTARALIAHFLYRDFNMGPREIRPLIGNPFRSRVSVYHYLASKNKKNKTLIEDRIPFCKELRLLKENIEEKLNGQKCK